jgi:hypothetical protein
MQPWLSSAAANPYIDFVSWHEYAGQSYTSPSDWPTIVSSVANDVPSDIKAVRSVVAQYDTGLQQNGGTHANTIPLLITEYNIGAGSDQSVGVGGALQGNPTYEVPFMGMYKAAAFNGGADEIDFFTTAGSVESTWIGVNDYLLNSSNEIKPWDWVEYLYAHSLHLNDQPFSVVSSTTSDTTQFPVAFKMQDGTYGVVVSNSDTVNPRSYTITINNTGFGNTAFLAHDYLVDPTNHDVLQPDLQGVASNDTIRFTVTVPPSSVNGFSIGTASGTAVKLPNYSFHPFSDDFSSYGGAGSIIARYSNMAEAYYTTDYTNWIANGFNGGAYSNIKTVTGIVATPASDGISFADSGAGAATTAMKVTGGYSSYARTGSYMVDWTAGSGQKVAVTFQTDWSNMSTSDGSIQSGLWLNIPSSGYTLGYIPSSPYYLLAQNVNGVISLKSSNNQNQRTLGAYAFTPTPKKLSSWRLVVDKTTAELDRYVTGTWHPVIGPVAHGLSQTDTGMEAGYLNVGHDVPGGVAGSSYWANISVRSLSTTTTATPTPTPCASCPTAKVTATPLPTLTPAPRARMGNTTAGTRFDTNDAHSINASQFSSGSGGTVVSMSVYVGAVGTSPNNQYQLAIYTDKSGVPGTLVTHSASGTLTGNSWNTVSVPATVLAPNTKYWLGYNTNGSSQTVNDMAYTPGGLQAWTTSAVTFGSWPAVFPASSQSTDQTFSIYASYQTGRVTATSTPRSTV